MFAIAVHNKQYKTYTLEDKASSSSIDVVPERGGIITSWRVKDRELLYLDAQRFANPELSVRGGIPILFPLCGNLPDNSYNYNGRNYHLKQHGFARDLPWEVAEQVTTDKASISLVLTSNEETLAVYPFEFKLIFNYQVKGNVLEISQRYINIGKEKMPFSSGLHPYFLAPDKSQLRFEIPAMQYRDQKTGAIRENIGCFDPNIDEIDVAFEKMTGLAASAYDASRDLRITVSYTAAYSTVVFWMLKGKEYFCLEPWTAPRNSMNTGHSLLYLEPGASKMMLVRFIANFF